MCMWLSGYITYVMLGLLCVLESSLECGYVGMFCSIHFIENLECGPCGSLVVGTLECWYVSMLVGFIGIW
jgi:hypothetical protein